MRIARKFLCNDLETAEEAAREITDGLGFPSVFYHSNFCGVARTALDNNFQRDAFVESIDMADDAYFAVACFAKAFESTHHHIESVAVERAEPLVNEEHIGGESVAANC